MDLIILLQLQLKLYLFIFYENLEMLQHPQAETMDPHVEAHLF